MYCVRIFIFLFRTKVKKDQLDDNNFRQGYGNYFKSAILNLLITAMLKVLSQQFLSRGTLTTEFDRHLTV